MLTHLTVAIAIASSMAGDQPAAENAIESLPRIQIGETSFVGDRVHFASVDGEQAGRFTCTLEGHAKLFLYQGDIEVTADKIQFEIVGKFATQINCTGSSTYKEDAGVNASGDRLRLFFGDNRDRLAITGNVTLRQGKTVVRAETITCRDGVYQIPGKATFRLAP